MLVGHNTVPLSLVRSTVTASVRRPGGGGGAGSVPSKSSTDLLLAFDMLWIWRTCTTNPQQIEVTESDRLGRANETRHACNEPGA